MGIECIRFANPVAVLSIHPWCFGCWIVLGSYRCGEQDPIGGRAFDNPQGVGIACSASSNPSDSPIDAGGGIGKIAGVDHRTGGSGENRVEVFTSVGVNTDDKWMSISDNRHCGPWAFPMCWTGQLTVKRPVPVRGVQSHRNNPVMGHTAAMRRTIFSSSYRGGPDGTGRPVPIERTGPL